MGSSIPIAHWQKTAVPSSIVNSTPAASPELVAPVGFALAERLGFSYHLVTRSCTCSCQEAGCVTSIALPKLGRPWYYSSNQELHDLRAEVPVVKKKFSFTLDYGKEWDYIYTCGYRIRFEVLQTATHHAEASDPIGERRKQ